MIISEIQIELKLTYMYLWQTNFQVPAEPLLREENEGLAGEKRTERRNEGIKEEKRHRKEERACSNDLGGYGPWWLWLFWWFASQLLYVQIVKWMRKNIHEYGKYVWYFPH